MNLWTILLDVLVLLVASMVLGGLFERLKQNAIIGYLMAGVLVGPHALNLMSDREAIESIAELGVALLLFMIGLEFSWRKLKDLGSIALGGGTLQVAVTILLTTLIGKFVGLEIKAAFVIGAMVALSSTAVVMRLLGSRREMDSAHGRTAVGILLLQDIAVVPLVLFIPFLIAEGEASQFGLELIRAVVVAILLALTLFVALKFGLPRVFQTRESAANRDLPILLAIITAAGCAWGSHSLGLSPVLGAFVGGTILAETPFAAHIRADIASFKTLFVTLFFASIGMMANPEFIMTNWLVVIALVAAIIIGKALVVAGVTKLFRTSFAYSVATGLCLAQIGEFSFVIAAVSRSGGLISGELFELFVAVTVVTLFLTPYLVAAAPKLATIIVKGFRPTHEIHSRDEEQILSDVVVIGFGPAGKLVVQKLCDSEIIATVIELKPRLLNKIKALNVSAVIGDAIHADILKHAKVDYARVVVVAIADPDTARQITEQIHKVAPNAIIIARSRYLKFHKALEDVGAKVIIDEEKEVGFKLFSELERVLELS